MKSMKIGLDKYKKYLLNNKGKSLRTKKISLTLHNERGPIHVQTNII